MLSANGSFLDTANLDPKKVHHFFQEVTTVQNRLRAKQLPAEVSSYTRSVALMFFENSTRTKLSFELASQHLKASVLQFDHQTSSIGKGETLLDTLENIQAMGVDVFVIRHSQEELVEEVINKIKTPVILAGNGSKGHPTQALLDAYTIYREYGQVSGKKVLFVGDIIHSRVAKSNFHLLSALGAEVAVCGPEEFIPSDLNPKIKYFENLDQALSWSDVCVSLRIQFERHGKISRIEKLKSDYPSLYGINKKRLAELKSDTIIMHPGPVNYGIELDLAVKEDKRCRILKQVENGLAVRIVLLANILGLKI